MEIEPAAGLDCSFAGGQEGRRSWVVRSFGPRTPMHQSAPVHWSQNSAASAYVGWDFAKIRKDRSS